MNFFHARLASTVDVFKRPGLEQQTFGGKLAKMKECASLAQHHCKNDRLLLEIILFSL
jgi:hypothetical protein